MYANLFLIMLTGPTHTVGNQRSPFAFSAAISSGVKDWSDQQVAAWLRDAMKLGDVADAASVEGGLDGATALELVRDDWMELGASGLEAAKIVAQLKKLV